MSKQIEELSRNLAGGMSRRRAFWRFFAGVGGALLGGKAATARNEGNSICVDFCRNYALNGKEGLSGEEFGRCVAASTRCPPGHCAVMINSGDYICVPLHY